MKLSKKIVVASINLFQKRCIITALFEEQKAIEVYIEEKEQRSLVGNIYLGKVDRMIPNLHAAFVRIAGNQTCYYPLEENEKVRAGDEVIVQVEKEALKEKAPGVTGNLSIPGKYMVLTTKDKRISVSAKLDREEKDQLRTWAQKQKEEAFGMILRTNAKDASEEELIREYVELKADLQKILQFGHTRTCYSCLYRSPSLFQNMIRDIPVSELQEVVTDDLQSMEEIRETMELYSDSSKLRFYEDNLLPLYKLYSLEHVMEQATVEKVWLKSGGFLVLQQTEACVVIDVNSGKFVTKRQETETYWKINCEAVEEIARQIRLRNLSGIILVDFINMKQKEKQIQLMQKLQTAVRKDPVQTKVIDLTALQIVEMTRKKVKKSLKEQLSQIRKTDCTSEGK